MTTERCPRERYYDSPCGECHCAAYVIANNTPRDAFLIFAARLGCRCPEVKIGGHIVFNRRKNCRAGDRCKANVERRVLK